MRTTEANDELVFLNRDKRWFLVRVTVRVNDLFLHLMGAFTINKWFILYWWNNGCICFWMVGRFKKWMLDILRHRYIGFVRASEWMTWVRSSYCRAPVRHANDVASQFRMPGIKFCVFLILNNGLATFVYLARMSVKWPGCLPLKACLIGVTGDQVA